MSIPLGIPQRRNIPFKERGGLAATITELTEEIRELYQADEVPWVVGYSGGKDSTAILQLVWFALEGLPEDKRTKPVHVISTDTLVENPIVASWVTQSLEAMRKAAEAKGLPITPHRLTPATKDSFWVGLIGKGYPAPRPKFRWCTERLKIRPSNSFIRNVVREHGETILVLGIRKAESQVRAKVMAKHEKRRVRDRLSPTGTCQTRWCTARSRTGLTMRSGRSSCSTPMPGVTRTKTCSPCTKGLPAMGSVRS
ncbi:hypothetical protein GCM10020219_062080 [Nonomuraea dietziae]